MPNIPVKGPNSPGTQFRFYNDGSKLVISDNGSRVDYYEMPTHSYSTYANTATSPPSASARRTPTDRPPTTHADALQHSHGRSVAEPP